MSAPTSARSVEIACERTSIKTLRFADAGGLWTGVLPGAGALLVGRELRLFASEYRNVLAARVLGGHTATIELRDRSVLMPWRSASAVRLRADAHGVRVSLLDGCGDVLADGQFYEGDLAWLTRGLDT
jgi:hypothetical protein